MSQPLSSASTNGSYPSTAGYTSVEGGKYEIHAVGTWASATVTVKAKRSSFVTLNSDLVFTADGIKIVEMADGWDVRFDVTSATTSTSLDAYMTKLTPNID